jgi:predicted TIM-barrel fold metal-dependent hydrolase
LRLDRYPNLAVDTAARLHDLAMQDRAVIESFFERFQTRILFGTDVELPRALSSMPAADARQRLTSVKSQYARELAYYRTSQRLRFGAREVQGIALPEPMARCFFQANAQSWLDLAPGV